MAYDLQAAVEEWIARLPDEGFRGMIARTRPPTEPIPANPNSEARY